MARYKSAAHASAAAAAHAADAADHAADTAVHAAATARAAAASARAASAATRCTAAAVVRNPCPASTEPEEDTEIDVELGTLESSSSSSSASSSPSSSSSASTLQSFKEMLTWLDSWSGIISQLVLTASMGVPVYPSYSHIKKKPDPQYLVYFIVYCCTWIVISTGLVFHFLGRSKKEKRLSLWMYRLYMMATCISMVLYIYQLIPHSSGVNLGAGIMIASVVFAHMTAWHVRLTYKRDPSASSKSAETCAHDVNCR